MKKIYELALINSSEETRYLNVDIYEYDTLEQTLEELTNKLNSLKSISFYDFIEISIQEQDEDGENINTYIFMEINLKEYLAGRNKNGASY